MNILFSKRSMMFAASALALCVGAEANTYTVLHSFQRPPHYFLGSLASDGSFLYGTFQAGTNSDSGGVFKIKPDGTGLVILHAFTAGSQPTWGVVLDGAGRLYGATYDGVFSINTDGSEYSVLHTFSHSADGYASGGLFLDGSGNLYGVNGGGGVRKAGTVFRLKTDGSEFTVLHSFTGSTTDGGAPAGVLTEDGTGVLYGTSSGGGAASLGAVYSIRNDGSNFTLLHSFSGSDGLHPLSSLLLDSFGNLFGTTNGGGAGNAGTIFVIRTDGSGFTVLQDLSSASDGQNPTRSLVLAGSPAMLYGTTFGGGASGLGTIFSLTTDGSAFHVLHTFLGVGDTVDGATPAAGLIAQGSVLFGTTMAGGSNNDGTIFKIQTSDDGYALLYPPDRTEGSKPIAPVALAVDGYLYGMTNWGGGDIYSGTAFRLRTDGTGFETLHDFHGPDGYQPTGGLVLDGTGFAYGTASIGGEAQAGVVFKMKGDGTSFEVLHSFVGGSADGSTPEAGLILDKSGFLYGTTSAGGETNVGTVFRVRTDGTNYSLLHSFSPGEGYGPAAPLILDEAGVLYGTTVHGGPAGWGTVFSLREDGSEFSVVHGFSDTGAASPSGPLALDNAGYLFGTTYYGGANGAGAIFAVGTSGSGFILLHSFTDSGQEPSYPEGGLSLDSSGNLFGTTLYGGTNGQGALYRIERSGNGFEVLHDFGEGDGDGQGPFAAPVLDSFGNLYGTTQSGGNNLGTVFKMTAVTPPPPPPPPPPPTTVTVSINGPTSIQTGTLGTWSLTVSGATPSNYSWVWSDEALNPIAGPSVTSVQRAFTAAETVTLSLTVTVASTSYTVTQVVTVTAPAPASCVSSSTTLCVDDKAGDNRFKVEASYATSQSGGSSGKGRAIPLATLGVTHGGLFWFFSPDNPELLVKVLNTCSFSNKIWVFASAGTNVGVTLTVTDTKTGAQKIYTNPDLQSMPPIQDTAALSTCP